MATFAEIVFSCLDILKERTDDAYYTEEHIIFLASKMRALLLERKYRGSRNGAFAPMSEENKQEICIDIEPASLAPEGCTGLWLRSVNEVPDTVGGSIPSAYTVSDMIHGQVTFIPQERIPYVGHNKWLKHIIYAAKSNDGHIYLTSSNPQAIYLNKIKVSGVFSNPAEAAKLSCNEDGIVGCDILKAEFPLEEALIPSCIELVIQELIGSRYAPEDKDNDAKDGLGDAAVINNKASNPVERSEASGNK